VGTTHTESGIRFQSGLEHYLEFSRRKLCFSSFLCYVGLLVLDLHMCWMLMAFSQSIRSWRCGIGGEDKDGDSKRGIKVNRKSSVALKLKRLWKLVTCQDNFMDFLATTLLWTLDQIDSGVLAHRCMLMLGFSYI